MRPTELLKEDHKVILRMIGVMDYISQKIEKGDRVEIEHLDKIVDFIKTFADKCHHGKEEGLLFPAMEKAGVPRDGGPISVMLSEHEQGREFVKGMLEGLSEIKKGNISGLKKFSKNAQNYGDLLKQHIDKEDNILYMIADMHLDSSEDKRLLEEFERVEKEVIGEDRHKEFHHLVEKLELIYINNKKEA